MDGKPLVYVKDNGCGMSEDTLIKAMRPASNNPLEARNINDLGRFGWGLKSASFSQARKLIVISKNNNIYSGAQWDLGDISGYEMDVFDGAECREILLTIATEIVSQSGTVVIWQDCDRLSDGYAISRDNFHSKIIEAKNKLSLIFHRYLEAPAGRRILVKLNEMELEAIDPFLKNHPATQPQQTEVIKYTGLGKIIVSPYILPHLSKLTGDEIQEIEGVEGINRNQGFYIYRNERLIIYGTWFGIFKHGDLSELIRVQVDIPNTMDDFWKISIDKNDAKIPQSLKYRLRDILINVSGKAKLIYKRRSKSVKIGKHQPAWQKYKKNGVIRYEISRDNDIYREIEKSISGDTQTLLDAYLSFVEQSLPVQDIQDDAADESYIIRQEVENSEASTELLALMIQAIRANFDGTHKELSDYVLSEDFFSKRKAITEQILKDVANG